MQRRALCAGLAASALAGCSPPGPSWTLSYRVIVKILADNREYEGESIFRSTYWGIPEGTYKAEHAHGVITRGEAIPIPVGAHGVIFGILGNVEGVTADHVFQPNQPYALFPLLSAQDSDFDRAHMDKPYLALAALTGVQKAPPAMWPQFVHFSNIADPSSAKLLTVPRRHYTFDWPTQWVSNETALGPGSAIRDVSLEVTHASPTQQIDRIAPWISRMKGAPATGGYDIGRDMPFAERLQFRNFKARGLLW